MDVLVGIAAIMALQFAVGMAIGLNQRGAFSAR